MTAKKHISAETPPHSVAKSNVPGNRTPAGSGDGRPGADPSAVHTSRRILDATAEVMSRNGMSKLSLSDVAHEAGVSRPTLYRWFTSKEELIDAFTRHERNLFESGVADATAGLSGSDRLDAALKFIVAYQQSYSGVRMIDIEPELVIDRIAEVLPLIRAGLEQLMSGPEAAIAAATATRVAVSHYVVRSDDPDQFLAQLRHAVGIKPS